MPIRRKRVVEDVESCSGECGIANLQVRFAGGVVRHCSIFMVCL